MPRRSPYSPEFRRDAVELVRSSSQSTTEIAHELGINAKTLFNWVSQAKVDDGDKEGLTTDERAELAKLRRKVRTLEMEREVLKKAAAFFAKETEGR